MGSYIHYSAILKGFADICICLFSIQNLEKTTVHLGDKILSFLSTTNQRDNQILIFNS